MSTPPDTDSESNTPQTAHRTLIQQVNIAHTPSPSSSASSKPVGRCSRYYDRCRSWWLACCIRCGSCIKTSIGSLLSHVYRRRLLFIILILIILLYTLFTYTPTRPNVGILCPSRHAFQWQQFPRQALRKTLSEVTQLQWELRRTHAVFRRDEVTEKITDSSSGNYVEVSSATAIAADVETQISASEFDDPSSSLLFPSISLPKLKLPYRWERRHFTAPWPTNRLEPPSDEDLNSRFAQWETDFSQLVKTKNGDVVAAFHDWIAPAVHGLSVHAAPIRTVDQAVVILDAQRDPLILFTIKHTFRMLGPGWALVIFHTAENENWLIEQLQIRPGEPGEHIQLQVVEPMEKAQINSLSVSSVFYERIGVETILIVQPDALMVRSPWLGTQNDRERWDHLLANYGYLGAPWGWCKENWCMTGGSGSVSIRKNSMMRDLIAEFRCGDWVCRPYDLFRDQEHHPDEWWKKEDTFISKELHLHKKRWEGRVPSQAQAAEFCVEQFDQPQHHPFFVYHIWDFQPESRWIPLLARVRRFYPELG